MNEKVMSFSSEGQDCTGSLFLPEGAERPPVIVMGHGYAAERHFGNRSYIEAFVKVGVAVLTFDYRGSGDSAGGRRRLVDPKKQVEDWEAAIEFLRSLFLVDASRIILWGSSLGGGHALTVAAKDQSLLGVIAQVPHCDSRSAFKNTPSAKTLSAVGHGVWDLLLSLFGKIHEVPVVGKPG
ncbi:MAG: alpha/beta fold hydrolase, partial [Pseudomonadales bacterium]|nr:alpha/beta fold hydrolase [Pseudomonadales bacterium]